MNKVYLLTGSNTGNRLNNLATARDQININIGPVLMESSVYETEAWGFEGDDFLNQCIQSGSELSPQEVMDCILDIENHLGRRRISNVYEDRAIDIDILFYNDEIINTPGLVIPHKEIENRRFVLEPLNEIAPGFIHPVYKIDIGKILLECSDENKVVVYTSS